MKTFMDNYEAIHLPMGVKTVECAWSAAKSTHCFSYASPMTWYRYRPANFKHKKQISPENVSFLQENWLWCQLECYMRLPLIYVVTITTCSGNASWLLHPTVTGYLQNTTPTCFFLLHTDKVTVVKTLQPCNPPLFATKYLMQQLSYLKRNTGHCWTRSNRLPC